MRQFKIQKENEFLFSKLKNISSRPAKPQMNDMFIKSEAKKLQFNQKVKQYDSKRKYGTLQTNGPTEVVYKPKRT